MPLQLFLKIIVQLCLFIYTPLEAKVTWSLDVRLEVNLYYMQ